MFSKLRVQEWLIGVGVVLLFGATLKPWFTIPGRERLGDIAPDAILEGSTSASVGLNVWDLGFTRWFVYLAIICAALLLIAAVFGETVHYAIVMATPTVLFSLISSIGLIARWIWPPGTDSGILGVPPYDVQALDAFYVAVAGSLLIFIASCWSIRDEHVPDGYAPAPEPEIVSLGQGHLDSAP